MKKTISVLLCCAFMLQSYMVIGGTKSKGINHYKLRTSKVEVVKKDFVPIVPKIEPYDSKGKFKSYPYKYDTPTWTYKRITGMIFGVSSTIALAVCTGGISLACSVGAEVGASAVSWAAYPMLLGVLSIPVGVVVGFLEVGVRNKTYFTDFNKFYDVCKKICEIHRDEDINTMYRLRDGNTSSLQSSSEDLASELDVQMQKLRMLTRGVFPDITGESELLKKMNCSIYLTQMLQNNLTLDGCEATEGYQERYGLYKIHTINMTDDEFELRLGEGGSNDGDFDWHNNEYKLIRVGQSVTNIAQWKVPYPSANDSCTAQFKIDDDGGYHDFANLHLYKDSKDSNPYFTALYKKTENKFSFWHQAMTIPEGRIIKTDSHYVMFDHDYATGDLTMIITNKDSQGLKLMAERCKRNIPYKSYYVAIPGRFDSHILNYYNPNPYSPYKVTGNLGDVDWIPKSQIYSGPDKILNGRGVDWERLWFSVDYEDLPCTFGIYNESNPDDLLITTLGLGGCGYYGGDELVPFLNVTTLVPRNSDWHLNLVDDGTLQLYYGHDPDGDMFDLPEYGADAYPRTEIRVNTFQEANDNFWIETNDSNVKYFYPTASKPRHEAPIDIVYTKLPVDFTLVDYTLGSCKFRLQAGGDGGHPELVKLGANRDIYVDGDMKITLGYKKPIY